MKSSFVLLVGTALLLATSCLLAVAQSNPYADVDKVATFSLDSSSVVICSETKSGDPKRMEVIERQLTRVDFDSCLWASKVNKTDLSVPAILNRVGADVTCVYEEFQVPSTAKITEKTFPNHLRSKGFVDVTVISSRENRKLGGMLSHQVVRARAAQGESPERPYFGFRAWTWMGSGRMANLVCVGPDSVMTTEASAIDAVGDSISIIPTTPN